MAKRKQPLAAMATEGAGTVIYIHGIGNKPKPSILKCQWDRALFGVPQHDRTRMAYWVNRDYYPTAEVATCQGSDVVAETLMTPSPNQLLALQGSPDVSQTIEVLSNEHPDRARFLEKVADSL